MTHAPMAATARIGRAARDRVIRRAVTKNARLLEGETGEDAGVCHRFVAPRHSHATVPSPEGLQVARTERSPGFGHSPLAFPGLSQWHGERQ